MTPDQDFLAALMAEEETEETERAQEAESSHTPDGPVTNGQLRAPRRWERLLVEAAVIGGEERWRTRIKGMENQLKL